MIKRIFTKTLQQMLAVFPVVAVVGPRQVGKSTLVQLPEIGPDRRYVTLDDPTMRSVAQEDPEALLDTAGPLTIDEVQLAPGLLRPIKRRIDADRRPGQYLLTGSAELNDCANLAGVLAGRVGVLRLPPVTWSEERKAKGLFWKSWLTATTSGDLVDALKDAAMPPFPWSRLLTGGFPLSLTAPSETARHLWLESFRTTYLERDLRRVSDIAHLADFIRLMELTAANTGALINQASLARDAGLATATAGRYLSILEQTLLIHRIAPFFVNIGKRLVKSPKLLWADTGLACHLLGIHSVPMLQADRLAGRLFETFLLNEIQALLPIHAPTGRLFFVRSHDGLEIDGLLQIGRKTLPFEVKSGRTVTIEDALPLSRWLDLNPTHGPGIVFYLGRETKPLAKNVGAVPVSALLT